MDLQVEANAHPQTANLRQLRRACIFYFGRGNPDSVSQPRRLLLLVLKSNYRRKPQPKLQNSPGFELQLDEATTQL